MKEAFFMKPIPEVQQNDNSEEKEKELKKEAKKVFQKYEGENGEVVYADHESDVGLNLPLSYTALPLTQKNNIDKLNDLRTSINILENKNSSFNPFKFYVNYKTDDVKLLMTSQEKLEQAKKTRKQAIEFVNKWNKELKIEYAKELAEDYEEARVLLQNIKETYQNIAMNESDDFQREDLAKLGEQFTESHKVLTKILENYENL